MNPSLETIKEVANDAGTFRKPELKLQYKPRVPLPKVEKASTIQMQVRTMSLKDRAMMRKETADLKLKISQKEEADKLEQERLKLAKYAEVNKYHKKMHAKWFKVFKWPG